MRQGLRAGTAARFLVDRRLLAQSLLHVTEPDAAPD